MSQELLYTSAPKGLLPGSRGFCTVLSTEGISAPLASALESLCGYRSLYSADHPLAHLNPIAISHLRIKVGGKPFHVLSRIAGNGLDYSQRSNKIAHHVVLEPNERVAAGPAEVLGRSGCMRTEFDGRPRVVRSGPAVQVTVAEPAPCREWERVTGDAGWSGVLAESFLEDPTRVVYLVFQPGMELLPLIAESIRLLPEESRWGVTFSTYFTALPVGVECLWRCVLVDSPEFVQSLRLQNALRIDLTGPLERARGGAFVESARTGIPVVSRAPARTPPEMVGQPVAAAMPPPLPVAASPPELPPGTIAPPLPATSAAPAAQPPRLPPPVPALPGSRWRRAQTSTTRRWLFRVVTAVLALALGAAAFVVSKNTRTSDANDRDHDVKQERPEQNARR